MTKSDVKQLIKGFLRGATSAAAPLFSKKTSLTVDDARDILLSCAPCPAGTCRAANVVSPPRCDLQIIIPAYNVEAYLADCMDSVLSQQTRYSFHVILVDDGAKDATPAICDRYSDHPNVTVIHQKNKGLSGARNTGLKELFSKYILFLDSDDLLLPGAIEAMLNTAFAHDADLVEGGAEYVFADRREIAHHYDTEAPLADPYRLHGHAWGKLYRADIFADLQFPEGFWYEDSLLSYLIFPAVKNVWLCPHSCTGYRINESGIVKSSVGKPRAVETYWITERLLLEHKEAGLPMDGSFFRYLLLQARLNQLRLSALPSNVQESAFLLTCDLLSAHFPSGMQVPGEKQLQASLRRKDFGMFKMCCKFF